MEASINRKSFLRYFFKSLDDCRYAALKYVASSINAIPESSDVDLLIEKKDLDHILQIINAGKNVLRVDLQHKSFVSFISIYFEDCGYLEIDLINSFDRKGKFYLEAVDILDDASRNHEGVKVASRHHHFEYVMLFYLLNNAPVPSRYREYFSQFSKEDRAKIFSFLISKYKLHINTLDDLYDPHKRHQKKILNKINHYSENKTLNCLPNKIRYWKDMISDFKKNRGYAVSFSGVDGSGKSTVLENTNKLLANKYRQRTIVLRHRPSLLPILSSFIFGKAKAQERAVRSLPRKGKNKNSISSLFRFSYYYADYLIGQWYIFFKYILKGYTVLYDRYYFDFIADSKRSNIVLNKSFIKALYFFVYKPEVNFFLSAPPETILQRKKELDVNDIQFLTTGYKKLFDDFGQRYRQQRYIAITNLNLDETLHTVIKECISVNC